MNYAMKLYANYLKKWFEEKQREKLKKVHLIKTAIIASNAP